MISRHETQNPFAPPAARLVEAADGSSWRPSPARPWRRYFARRIDQFITLLIVSVCLAPFIAGIHEGLAETLHRQGLLHAVAWRTLALGLGVFLEAAWLAWVGTTPGKWFFGLRVLRPDGGRIGYVAALRRSARVFARGTGLGLPGIAPFLSLLGLLQTRKRGHTSWDPPELHQVESRHPTDGLWVLAILASILAALFNHVMTRGLSSVS
ncbi:MAG TPA: RDD family protein [Holophagaceae bacterium]|nr:RDD family protein [Holophagaceae bacterium]